ncbi:CarD family transcriptional regulator [Humitalea rosea]|uniref:CarD family transcriptional regulator n=1 Tax=Humitalea rosea TaxID=990373 RepID=A0A2W7KPX8_9PROT|nr:CarD family transcriptional regulator [Humitalea rosea]PZW50375.1 CarD family transcriptional regulator [Humitalea rosea]
MTDTPPPPPTYTSAPVLAPTGVARPPVSGMPKPPPKPLGNDGRDFKAGDHVVYPTHGVGQVQGIEEIIVMGSVIGMIVVTFDENRMTLKVPISKASTAGLRMLADGPKIGEALDTLKGRARIKRTMWSRRAQEYEQKINSGDPISIAEVVRDLHRNSGQPDQSFSERQIYEQALDRLAAEVAAIDKTDKPTAVEKLLATLKLGLAS